MGSSRVPPASNNAPKGSTSGALRCWTCIGCGRAAEFDGDRNEKAEKLDGDGDGKHDNDKGHVDVDVLQSAFVHHDGGGEAGGGELLGEIDTFLSNLQRYH